MLLSTFLSNVCGGSVLPSLTVRYSRGCEFSSRLGRPGSSEIGMLSFTNKHSLNPGEIGRQQGTKRPRAHLAKGGKEKQAKGRWSGGMYGPITNIPEFVLNEFELSLPCPAKEASILRPRGIRSWSRPLATAP